MPCVLLLLDYFNSAILTFVYNSTDTTAFLLMYEIPRFTRNDGAHFRFYKFTFLLTTICLAPLYEWYSPRYMASAPTDPTLNVPKETALHR